MGVIFALVAFVTWGLAPLFWRALESVPAQELVIHRMIWGFATLTIVITLQKRWKEVFEVIKSPKIFFPLLLSALLIFWNWYLFIVAVNTHNVLQASLGYYLNPLVNVFFGLVFFKETIKKQQAFAISIAALGVGVLVGFHGEVPKLALLLCSTFAGYGVLRKSID
ncbi:MAG: EamA family transporter RarD, partial [Bdellovibrionales bacterium]|nr:EamA family transporter RarD [Bdellovibrionales bacterium]